MALFRRKATIQKARKPRIGRPAPPFIAHAKAMDSHANAMENAVHADFLTGIQRFKRNIGPKALAQAIDEGDIGKVQMMTYWAHPEGVLGKVMDQVDTEAANAAQATLENASDTVKDVVQDMGPTNPRYAWDDRNPHVQSYLRERLQPGRPDWFLNIKQDGKDNIRNVIAEGQRVGATSRSMAKQIIDTIGLNVGQANALANYRTKMEQQYIEGKIDKDTMTTSIDEFGAKKLKERARTIAVTESRNAVGNGQLAGWHAAIQDGTLPGGAMKVWVNGWAHACDACKAMHDTKVPISEPWKLPSGKLCDVPTDSHPLCKCVMYLDLDSLIDDDG